MLEYNLYFNFFLRNKDIKNKSRQILKIRLIFNHHKKIRKESKTTYFYEKNIPHHPRKINKKNNPRSTFMIYDF